MYVRQLAKMSYYPHEMALQQNVQSEMSKAAQGCSSDRSIPVLRAASISFQGSRSPGRECTPALRMSNLLEIEYCSARAQSCFSAYAARMQRLERKRTEMKRRERSSVEAILRESAQERTRVSGEFGTFESGVDARICNGFGRGRVNFLSRRNCVRFSWGRIGDNGMKAGGMRGIIRLGDGYWNCSGPTKS